MSNLRLCRLGGVMLFACALLSACDVGIDTKLDASAKDGGSKDAAADRDAATTDSLVLQAVPAKKVGELVLDEPLGELMDFPELTVGLHTTEGVSVMGLLDPTKPEVISRLPTTGTPVAVTYDVELRILYILSVSGDLRAYRVTDVTAPVQIAQSTISEPKATGDVMRGMVRVGNRLYLLGKARLLPVSVMFGADDIVSFVAETSIEIDADSQALETGGGVIYVSFKGGKVQLWSAGSKPALLDTANLGADIQGWVVRGRRIFAALKGIGLRVVDLSVTGQVSVLYEAAEFNDLTALKRFGNLVLVSLSRGLLVALDLSDISAPRGLVSREGTLPDWIAPSGGNLLLGSAKSLTVFGVPPFVNASVPSQVRTSFPRYGRIPLQLSKPVDPKTITVKNIKLLCGGTSIEGTVVVSLDNYRITFLPTGMLPAGVDCNLTLNGVKDALGLNLSSGQSALNFTTTMAAPAPVENPKSKYPHTADGAFTDWSKGTKKDFEYSDISSARGMYSNFYADYDGKKLWMLNDWFYNGDDINPDCYNQFGVWTGNGSESWDIRAYGDQHIEVRLNGTLLAADDTRVSGGYTHGASPNLDSLHTIYEIAVEVAPGGWGVQLHDPGPSFGCEQLEPDPTNYNGASTAMGSTIDPTMAPATPPQPVGDSGRVQTGTPTLSWVTGQDASGSFASYLLEISSGDDLSNVIYSVWVYGPSFTLPPNLLQDGMTYTWRVTAYNLAGATPSELVTFTVGAADVVPEPVPVDAPVLTTSDPNSATVDQSLAVTIIGTGFIVGAQAYLGQIELNTTFVSDTQLTAMIPASATATANTLLLTVRNDPSDAASVSNGLKFDIAAPVVPTVTLTSVSPTSFAAATKTPVTVNMGNAPMTGTYTLKLQVDGGGETFTFACPSGETNTCTADANVPVGTYDVSITVGGATPYDTNVLNANVTTFVPCAHNECLPGVALETSCSACATSVCTTTPACCVGGQQAIWSSSCVIAADNLQLCACTRPTLSSPLSPASGLEGTAPVVTATILNGSASVTYQLVLTPLNIGGSDTVITCSPGAQQGTCTATVPSGLLADSYQAKIRVTGSSGATFDTNILASGYTQKAP